MKKIAAAILVSCVSAVLAVSSLAWQPKAVGLFDTHTYALASEHVIYRADGVTKVSEASDMCWNSRTGELVVLEQLNRLIHVNTQGVTTREVAIGTPPNNDYEGIAYLGDDGVNDFYAVAFEGKGQVSWITVPFAAASIPAPTESYRIFRVDSAPLWQPTTAYLVNSFVSLSSDPQHLLRCVKAGTSGTGEPVWPAGSTTIIDGSCTWVKAYEKGIEALCVNPNDWNDFRAFKYDIGGLKSYQVLRTEEEQHIKFSVSGAPTNVRAATWNLAVSQNIIVCSSGTSDFRLREINPETGAIVSVSPQFLWPNRKCEGVVFPVDAGDFWGCAEAGGDLTRLFHYVAQ